MNLLKSIVSTNVLFYNDVRLRNHYKSYNDISAYDCWLNCYKDLNCVAITFCSSCLSNCYFYNCNFAYDFNQIGWSSYSLKKFTIESPRVTNWGDWGGWAECTNSFAVGFITKVESSQGIGDDTAMNGLYLYCSDNSRISSSIGPWGDWDPVVRYCDIGKKIKAFAIKIESDQGSSGDDTATNGIQFKCEDDKVITSFEGGFGKKSFF